MADLSQSARNSIALQREMFRLAETEHGLSLAVLAKTRKLSASTIKGWRDGSAMPAWALGELRLPDDVVSLILTPYEKHVGTDEPGDGDLDSLACEAAGLVNEYVEAKSDGHVNHIEEARIRARARRLTPKSRAVARRALTA
tara:strand:- start:21755 stop:22180 length:426 start_codon:yes stop_codon:yes gene_type:complete